MFQLWVEKRRKCASRGVAGDVAPDGRAAIGFFGERAKGIASLEGEVLLYGVDGRKVVIFRLAKL